MSAINGDKARISQRAQEEDRETATNARPVEAGPEIELLNAWICAQITRGEDVTESILDLRFSQPVPPDPVKKKRVLLVDNSPVSRDLRAEVMRKVGMDVDCAADMTEARVWWRADLYNLVLISAATEQGRRDKFCADIRGATPSQRLAFLVGKPEYLADSPNPNAPVSASEDDGHALLDEVRAALATHVAKTPSQKWGILEACQRISVVRAAADAHTRAIRQRPSPPRDSETSRTPRDTDSQISSELKT